MVKKDVVLETLNSLVKDGRIFPEDVVESARDENSPIHNKFEWDDTTAGQEYRLWQARQLITIKFSLNGDKTQQFFNVRAIINDVPTQGYFTKEMVLSDKEMYNQVLKEALSEIKYWQKKYKSIKELEGVVNEERLSQIQATI
jgi:hypothetical protein